MAAASVTACRSSREAPAKPASPDTWAVVDGRTITAADVNKAYRRSRDTSQPLSDEETAVAQLGLLNELIVQDILIARAGALKLNVPDSDIDNAYANAKKNVPDDAFQQELTRRSLTTADLRESLRRELLAQKVVDQEVGSKISVSDKEISDFYTEHKSQFTVPEEAYHLAQIVVTPVRDQQVANGTGDDAATPQEAAAKAQMLMQRLKAGASFQELAAGYSEDPNSAPRGGDLGLVPVSRLKQAPPALRDAVLNKEPGTVNVATVGGAYTLVLVVSHEQAGVRDLSTAGVRDGISQTLRGRKEQLLRTAYLTAIRNDAHVVNYAARRLVDSNGAVASLPAGATGATKP